MDDLTLAQKLLGKEKTKADRSEAENETRSSIFYMVAVTSSQNGEVVLKDEIDPSADWEEGDYIEVEEDGEYEEYESEDDDMEDVDDGVIDMTDGDGVDIEEDEAETTAFTVSEYQAASRVAYAVNETEPEASEDPLPDGSETVTTEIDDGDAEDLPDVGEDTEDPIASDTAGITDLTDDAYELIDDNEDDESDDIEGAEESDGYTIAETIGVVNEGDRVAVMIQDGKVIVLGVVGSGDERKAEAEMNEQAAEEALTAAEAAQETANGAAAKAELVTGIVSGTDTFDISVSGSLSEESTQIDIQAASGSGKFTTPGEYTFSYSDSGWRLGGNSVTLSEYGITLNGTPAAGDTITVVYDDSGLVDEIDELNRRADGISSDVGSLSDAASALQEQADGLSEATLKLKAVQETTSREMAGIAKEMEGYRGCVVIDGDEPSITVGAGSDAKTNLKITPEKMSFMNNGNEAASLSNDTLKADSAEITNLYMRSVDDSGNVVGTLGWIARANGHLSLRVIG